MSDRALIPLFLCLVISGLPGARVAAGTERVVINEIHFEPPQKKPVEFVELHNPDAAAVSLAGWSLDKFEFPAGAGLAATGYVVVALEPTAFAREFGFKPFGPLPGKLSHRGEKLTLRDAAGRVVDAVKYGVGFPWPAAAAGGGPSLERVHPSLPGGEPASWRSAGYPLTKPRAGEVFIAADDARWRWRKGTNEASNPRAAWRQLNFAEDGSWQTGRAPIGYGDDDDHTVPGDMQGRYSSVFLRRAFVVSKEKIPPALLLRVRVDDGCVVWLNGREVARLHLPPGDLPFNGLGQSHEATDEFEEVFLADAAKLLAPGTNLLAVQAFNASLHSSDLTFDAELRTPEGAPGGRRPTPGAVNSVFTADSPPAIREIAHSPAQPKSREPVVMTARVAARAAVRAVTLHLQVAEPGNYLRKTDAAYESSWRDSPMRDDGRDGDARADDGVFSVVVPAEFQQHRRLVRYRVTATDRDGLSVRVPYADDPCPNFAWFVSDGVPAWTGASQPGKTPPLTFPSAFLNTLPTYHLLARAEDVERSQWDGSFNKKRFFGTLIYDGHVYDHIQFHNRGQASTYVAGKNKWGFKFNRAHDFQPRDNYGRPYRQAWNSFSMNACGSPWAQVNRGMAGMDEAVAFRAYQLAGVPSANTHWVHFRVIDGAEEAPAKSQYDGDLWGLYLAVQDPDGPWLRASGLPDGNTYSPEHGRAHLAAGMPADNSDWNDFANRSRSETAVKWWRENLDLPAYYSFHAINRIVANIDLRHGANHYFYHRPDGHWAPVPWDLDMMFIPKTHWPGIINQTRCLDAPALRLEYQNRAREILDLFCSDASPGGGQIGQLIDEFARVLRPAGHERAWPELDQAVWNWHPRNNAKGHFYLTPYDDGRMGGGWRRTLATPDFAGSCRYLVEFCTDSRPVKNYAPNDGDQRGYGYGFLWWESKDEKIPARPIVRSAGPAGFAADQLDFAVSPFTSPVTNKFAAVQWRVGEVSAPGLAGFTAGQPRRYEIETHWTSEAPPASAATQRVPAGICTPGHTYRVRAHYQDHTGRWSRWSEPVQFVAGPPGPTNQ